MNTGKVLQLLKCTSEDPDIFQDFFSRAPGQIVPRNKFQDADHSQVLVLKYISMDARAASLSEKILKDKPARFLD